VRLIVFENKNPYPGLPPEGKEKEGDRKTERYN
jgi:hypothetical protein